MPIYDYSCGRCGWNGELMSTVGERDSMACPRCGCLEPLERALSAPLFRFAGRVTPGGGPDKFTADMLGVPLKDLPDPLRTEPVKK